MRSWHPLSKLLVPTGLLAVGWLVVSGPAEAPATVAAARLRSPSAAAEPGAGDPLGALGALGYQLALPPRESFRAAIERPLFAPSRRPAPPAEAPAATAEPTASLVEAEPAGPPFRLIGTVGRRGRSEALVAAPGSGSLERVAVGGRIAGWLVSEIGIDHLIVEREGERRRLAILR